MITLPLPWVGQGDARFIARHLAVTLGQRVGGILQWTGSWPAVFFTLAGFTVASIALVNVVRE